ncbi:topoisomerase IA [Candidatus Scalindua japonica]|uniref:Topoisomerase IA n=1 Tax=Candidatus Scalindua japonica TaxID=1284222 RepID=A0A286TXI4_9BACT|nr:hypothetical protein [Candidatus Scalindua japonica]GAX60586.1 topoisomerase IA [Candidatus Scalindua japonica]
MDNTFKYFFALLLIAVLFAGCKTGEEPVSELPEFYSWDEITKEDKEDTGYGVYTYVLFGRRVDNPGALDPETRERYLSLLNSVIGSADYGGKDGTRRMKKGLSNVFYLPAKIYFKATGLKPKAQYYAREIYDSNLSTYLLATLRKATENTEIRQQFTTGPGPFLISTLQPIGQYHGKEFSRNSVNNQKTTSVMLYANLSKTNPDNMKEIVSTYKRYIKEAKDDAEKLKPLQLSLVDLVQNANENLQSVKIRL